MGLLNRIKMLWRAAVGSSYSWPAMDIVLPGERYLHLVGSIHMVSLIKIYEPTRRVVN